MPSGELPSGTIGWLVCHDDLGLSKLGFQLKLKYLE